MRSGGYPYGVMRSTRSPRKPPTPIGWKCVGEQSRSWDPGSHIRSREGIGEPIAPSIPLNISRKPLPNMDFRMVIGTDVLHERHLWKEFDRLIELAPPILLGREDYPCPEGFEALPRFQT